MKLMSLREFGERFYSEESRPGMWRLRRLAAAGRISAVQIGGRWFVDIEKFEIQDDVFDLVKKILEG